MRGALAVRLDIRPRIVLRDERQAPRRFRLRLPPLALPAAGYWVAMGALTYFFAHLGPNPLESIESARASEPQLAPAPAEPPPVAEEPAPLALTEPPPAAPSADELPAAPNALLAETADEPEPTPERPRRRDDEPRASRYEDDTVASRDLPAPPEAPQAKLSFPEFTDSSRPATRERAADGPRIDSLFERAEEQPDAREPAAPPREAERGPARAVVSCEAAVARNSEQLEIGGPRGPADISREAYASILQNGTYLSACNIPDRTVFEICAAVKDGRAVGITVVSSPADSGLNACVRGAVSRLKFPSNPRLDVTHTRFDAARR